MFIVTGNISTAIWQFVSTVWINFKHRTTVSHLIVRVLHRSALSLQQPFKDE